MLIGIVGAIGAGKNTTADILHRLYGYQPVSFADSLKDVISSVFGYPRHLMEGNTEESRIWREQIDPWWAERLNLPDFTPRKAMQLIGTNVFRDHFSPDIWIASLERKIQDNQNHVVSDARFGNEIAMIYRLGGEVWEVTKDQPLWYSAAKKFTNSVEIESYMTANWPEVHRSEWSWMGHGKINQTINNNGTKELLEIKVRQIIEKPS